MEIVIHQSLCGENNNKAWDLLSTTLPDNVIAKNIAFKADLQDQAGGIAWGPVIRGFMHDDFYQIMRTFPDTSANVRSGRAFSHVLHIARNDIPSISNIELVLQYLPTKMDKTLSLSPIIIQNSGEVPGALLAESKSRFNKVIKGYVSVHEFRNTIIWVGNDGFEHAVIKLWQILPPSEIEKLVIDISFNVNTITGDNFNFITTPVSIESKFTNSGFCVVRTHDTEKLTELSEQIIAGYPTARKRIQVFTDTIEAKPLDKADIDKVAIVIRTFENYEKTNDIKKLMTLAQVVAIYSPGSDTGTDYKAALMHKIASTLGECELNSFLLIRNLTISAYEKSLAILASAIQSWLASHLLFTLENMDYPAFFVQLRSLDKKNWWRSIIEESLKTFLSTIRSQEIQVVYHWLGHDFQIWDDIQARIDKSQKAEAAFIAHLPNKMGKTQYKSMKAFSLKRKWYSFHALLVSINFPVIEAFSEQLKVDSNPGSTAGLALIAKGCKPIELVEFAVENGDPRLIDFACAICQKTSSVLDNIDVKNMCWQEIWLKCVLNGNQIGDGLTDPKSVVDDLLNIVVDDCPYNEELLLCISESEYASILHYEYRVELWKKLKATIKENLLACTASEVIDTYVNCVPFDVREDRVLHEHLKRIAIPNYLDNNSASIKAIIHILQSSDAVPDYKFRQFIEKYKKDIDVIEAKQLGEWVNKRRLYSVAKAIYGKAEKTNNWKIALKECYGLLGFFTKGTIVRNGLIDNVKIEKKQWWKAFNEIACRLYSSGPKDNKIWLDAGGEEYDLLATGTGKEMWKDALNKLKNNGCENITVEKLLKAMLKDYKKNEDLKMLKNLWDEL